MTRRPTRSLRLALAAAAAAAAAAASAIGACVDTGPRSATVTTDSAAGELDFRLAGPGGAALVVPVRINGGEPIDLILDTGATTTCLDAKLVDSLGLPEQRAVIGAMVGIGGSGRVRIHRVDSIQVGTAVARGLSICSMDLAALRMIGPQVQGLLGLNVLRNYRITLDFERNSVRFEEPGGSGERGAR